MRFSPDGNRFVAFGQEETAGIFETATGKLEHTLVHRGVVADAVFSNDGRLVATCSFVMKTSGYAQVWDAKTGTAISQPLPGREELHRVALSPDSTLVCATERGGGVRVWTVETGRECLDPLPHDAAAFPVAFTSDGKRLFTVANGKVQLHELWDLPGPAPAWLPDLAEAVGGLKMSDKGVAVPIGSPVQALAILRAKGSAMTTDDRLSIWARWFFADRHTRMASPFSQPTPSH